MFRFIVSDRFDYSKKISRDVGPKYAESLGISWAGIGSAREMKSKWVAVDEALQDEEMDSVRQLIDSGVAGVLLKVSDPGWRRATRPATRGSYYRLIEDCCDRPNVAMLSMYEPSEWLADLLVRKQPKILVLPYPYVRSLELPLDRDGFGARLDKAIMTGATSRRKYPDRTRLRWRRALSRRVRSAFDVLDHPGYPDTGEALRHNLVFDEFVRFLAGYQYCFLCPSRWNLELLKYTECAYAGCVPVGTPAASLPAEARQLFLDVSGFLAVRNSPSLAATRAEHFARAQTYRCLMRAARDPHLLRERILSFARATF